MKMTNIIKTYMDYEFANPDYVCVMKNSQSNLELRLIAKAACMHHDSLADANYRVGGSMCDPVYEELAKYSGYSPE
jgi:hypothetical protein